MDDYAHVAPLVSVGSILVKEVAGAIESSITAGTLDDDFGLTELADAFSDATGETLNTSTPYWRGRSG